MPGRGRSWRGVGEGNPDRIGTAAIADGSITEADLDSSVQTKLNSGGGGGGFPDPVTDFEFYDEFIYNTFINENWEQLSGTGTWDVTISAIGGIVGRNTSGETSSGGGLRLNQNSLCDVTKDFLLRWRARSVDVSLLATRLGFYPANFSTSVGTFPFGTEPTNRIVFAHNGTEVDTNWRAVTNNGESTSTDTGVAVDTTFHVFEINRSGSTITFLIDGSQVAQHTTNLPTGNLQLFYYSQDGENVSKQQQIDTAQLQSTR